MAKRFTDTAKWSDPWFRKLSPNAKVLWFFLTENCDQAGYWKKDYELATFFCGYEVTEDHLLTAFNGGKDRVKDFGSHVQISDFISFQYGHLSPDCRPHRPILDLLEKYKKKGYQKGINTLEEQEKEKELKGVVGGFPPSLENCVVAFGEKGYSPAEAGKFWNHYEARGWMMGKVKMKKWRSAVATWIGQGKQFGTLEKLPPQKQEYKAPQEPEIRISDEERRNLIKQALPNYEVKV